MTMRSVATICGSPPRVWGRLRRSSRRPCGRRFTPTCVGKARGSGLRKASITVHPHVCGEGALITPVLAPICGSPPRVWGRLGHEEGVVAGRRFTPTCVGKAQRVYSCWAWTPVHPHVCGEGGRFVWWAGQLFGSPPRVWGRRPRRPEHRPNVRFTPTCVGKASAIVATPAALRGSPPRVWGRRRPLVPLRPAVGSPPRVWGRRRELGGHAVAQRFTPTCVGKAPLDPRALPPPRFTPTCVGKARSRQSCSAAASVHPHVCGEGSVP